VQRVNGKTQSEQALCRRELTAPHYRVRADGQSMTPRSMHCATRGQKVECSAVFHC